MPKIVETHFTYKTKVNNEVFFTPSLALSFLRSKHLKNNSIKRLTSIVYVS